MEDGFEVVSQQVVLLLPLFRDHPLCGPTKRIQISFCTGADELSQQFTVCHSSYAVFMSNRATGSSEASPLQSGFPCTCATLSPWPSHSRIWAQLP